MTDDDHAGHHFSTTDDDSAPDAYGVTAEFYDLWAHAHWEALAPSLRAALGSGIDPAAGPVVDLGAGTGWGTLTIADAVADVSIQAVEPSRTMRAMLLSRLMDHSDVRSRVTVVPCGFAEFSWPEQISGFVAMGVLGHVKRVERAELWRQLEARLSPTAPAVIQLQAPERPVEVPPVRHSVVEVGDHTYEGWSSASPIGRAAMRWTLRTVVRYGDQIIDDRCCISDFRTVSADGVRDEAAVAGLSAICGPASLLIVHRR